MTYVAGVDGCRTGWLVVLRSLTNSVPPLARLVANFADILALPEAPEIIAIDIPIGLPERSAIGGRQADISARSRLGARQSSVFAVPARAAVMASDYAEACARSQRNSDPPRKVSKQTFNLFPKIREVDALMTPKLQARVFECHPETAFWAMNMETPLDQPKKVKSRPHELGLSLRRGLLAAAGFPPNFLATTHVPTRCAGADDFLDACACSWSAARILSGTAHCFPADPPRDARGLTQQIWA